MNEIIKSLYNRKSMRVYEEKSIPQEMKKVILEAAAQAPTAGCQQLYTILDITDEELKMQEKSNMEIFLDEFRQNLDGLEDNMLYEDMCNPSDELMEDIFNVLLEKDVISEKDFINI